ncbi:transcriptional regulator [Mycobacterium sp. ENV421]|uniref:GAF domain-containing protein n=1 Tax=Mycobacterium sp. ENV421 TaxID=1213407 RepID=UPI000C9A13FE|nr:GAF domain-containing protein [Mycobacterium sp. ENV421]PND54408.1 transcriptional regulator [Mycobacterium sp. ENV421]
MLKHTPHQRRCELEAVWEGVVTDGGQSCASEFAQLALRPEIAQSWARSLKSVDPACGHAPSDEQSTPARWTESPLRQPIDELAADLQQIADAGFVVGVSDEFGSLLWTCGGRVMRRRAERANFAPGGCWSESAIGTNAVALALDTRRPSTVFSAEHLVETLHDWVCYSAPVHNPQGKTLGVLDLSTTCDRANPLAMATVRTLASLVETRLRELQAAGVVETSTATVTLRSLGRTEVCVDGACTQVSPRQVEILTLLALRPDGYTPAELSLELYGDRPVSMSTLKGEVSRLRRVIGGGIAAHRYMLTTPVRCDARDVLESLTHGDVAAAAGGYRGPLLPTSEAPGIVDWRARLEVAIREAALRSDDPGPAIALGERIDNDPELYEHALALLSPNDARMPLVAGRLHVLRQDWD